jgi:DNA-binding CsgD family transcriptional regulator
MLEQYLLTRQEQKVLLALGSGKLYKEIASANDISINTVKKHLKNIYRKLNVHSRLEATRIVAAIQADKNFTINYRQSGVQSLHIQADSITHIPYSIN